VGASISKTPVTLETAAAIVGDAFGDDVSLAGFEELTEGWFNAAHLLTLDDDQRYVLKVAPPPGVAVLTYERDIMATEVAALRLVRHHTSVPVPEVVWSDTSCRRLPSSLFVMEHCPGTLLSSIRPTLDTDRQRFVDAQLARYLREMNAIASATFGLQAPQAPAFTRWSDAFVHLVDDVLTDGSVMGVELPASDAELRSLVRGQLDALDEVTEARFVHWDLWDGNVFVDPTSLAVLGVIDFERALWGDPLMEVQFSTRIGDPAFLAAYGEPVSEAPGAVRRRLLYDLYLFLIMVIETAYRHYPTDDLERFARQRLAVTLERLR